LLVVAVVAEFLLQHRLRTPRLVAVALVELSWLSSKLPTWLILRRLSSALAERLAQARQLVVLVERRHLVHSPLLLVESVLSSV
jgi:hypothetical protein